MNFLTALQGQLAGRWICYRDPHRMFLGVNTDGASIIVACFGLVAEYIRPAGFSARAVAVQRRRTIRRWQKVRNQLWARALLVLSYQPGESADELDQRRAAYLERYYEVRAADARALHPERWIPALAELAVAPMADDLHPTG